MDSRTDGDTVDDGKVDVMDPELERVLRGLEEAAEWAKTFRFEMTEDYIRLIERVEAMPRNQSGADKSGPWVGSYPDAVRWFSHFKLVPRKR
jgi:hypothetical protein